MPIVRRNRSHSLTPYRISTVISALCIRGKLQANCFGGTCDTQTPAMFDSTKGTMQFDFQRCTFYGRVDPLAKMTHLVDVA
jgi:hypothetical protein